MDPRDAFVFTHFVINALADNALRMECLTRVSAGRPLDNSEMMAGVIAALHDAIPGPLPKELSGSGVEELIRGRIEAWKQTKLA